MAPSAAIAMSRLHRALLAFNHFSLEVRQEPSVVLTCFVEMVMRKPVLFAVVLRAVPARAPVITIDAYDTIDQDARSRSITKQVLARIPHPAIQCAVQRVSRGLRQLQAPGAPQTALYHRSASDQHPVLFLGVPAAGRKLLCAQLQWSPSASPRICCVIDALPPPDAAHAALKRVRVSAARSVVCLGREFTLRVATFPKLRTRGQTPGRATSPAPIGAASATAVPVGSRAEQWRPVFAVDVVDLAERRVVSHQATVSQLLASRSAGVRDSALAWVLARPGIVLSKRDVKAVCGSLDRKQATGDHKFMERALAALSPLPQLSGLPHVEGPDSKVVASAGSGLGALSGRDTSCSAGRDSYSSHGSEPQELHPLQLQAGLRAAEAQIASLAAQVKRLQLRVDQLTADASSGAATAIAAAKSATPSSSISNPASSTGDALSNNSANETDAPDDAAICDGSGSGPLTTSDHEIKHGLESAV
jgi:hypothetical protein